MDIGFNSKFTDLQAVIGIEQMKVIDFRVKRKKEIYNYYREILGGMAGVEMLPIDLEQTPPWFVDIFLPSKEMRDSLLIVHLKQHNISLRPFYPPINQQAIYSDYPKGSFPVSESMHFVVTEVIFHEHFVGQPMFRDIYYRQMQYFSISCQLRKVFLAIVSSKNDKYECLRT